MAIASADPAIGPAAVSRGAAPRRPRVVFFSMPAAPEIYGGTRSLLMALQNLRELDAVLIAALPSPDHPLAAELRRVQVAHEILTVPPARAGRWGRLARARQVTRLLLPALRRHAPDAVHADADVFLYAALAARRAGCRAVVHVRNLQPRSRVGTVRQLLLASADGVVFITESLRQFYLRGIIGPLRGRVARRSATVHNGFALAEIRSYEARVPRERARRDLGMEAGEVAVALVGAVCPRKGQLDFLRTVAPVICRENPDVRLWLVGGGDSDPVYAAACREAADAAGLGGRVVFAGFHQEIYPWYRAMDVLAFPSRREGLGRVAIEAQAFGVPVVASDIVGVRDALHDGEGGFLVSTTEAWTARLTELVRSPDLRREVGERGRKFVQRFDAGQVTRDLESFYTDLLS